MPDNELHAAAQSFLSALDVMQPSADWVRIEEEGQPQHVDTDQPTARSLLETARWVAEQVVDARGLVVAENRRSREFLDALSGFTESISDFSLSRHDPNQFRTTTSEVQHAVRVILTDLGHWASTHAGQRAGTIPESHYRESARLLAEIRNNAALARKTVDEARSEVIKAGAAVFAESFEKEAEESSKRSTRWLCAGIGTLLSGAGVAIWIIRAADADSTPANVWEWLQPLAGKLFLLSLLTYATTWCGRVSLASRHSASVNRHRAHSLTTVKAFRESGTDNATKDAIVLEAARAVFENVQTGYLGKSSEQQPVVRTLEMLKLHGK